MELFSDRINSFSLNKIESAREEAHTLKAKYDELTKVLENTRKNMPRSTVYEPQPKMDDGYFQYIYDYDRFSAEFCNLHSAMIQSHKDAYVDFHVAEREYYKIRESIIDEVGNAAAHKYKRLAEEIAKEHAILYGILHSVNATATQLFRQINLPSGVTHGNLINTTDKPHGRHSLLYESSATNNGNKMAAQVRKFKRDF